MEFFKHRAKDDNRDAFAFFNSYCYDNRDRVFGI